MEEIIHRRDPMLWPLDAPVLREQLRRVRAGVEVLIAASQRKESNTS